MARLAVVPLVLEARGLDVTPQTVAPLEAVGDLVSGRPLQRILADEIGHVSIDVRWFESEAAARGEEPAALWDKLVRDNLTGR